MPGAGTSARRRSKGDPAVTETPGIEQPIEDVLEQHRGDEDPPAEHRPSGEEPGEADEVDYHDQRVEVPLEDDRYPNGGVSG